jgi:hypothetical protein
MLLPKSAAYLIASILGLGLTAEALAGEAVNPENRPEAITFAARLENGELMGDEQIRRIFFTVGSSQFGFIVPSGLQVDLARADRLTLTAPDLSYFFTLRIMGNSSTAGLGISDGFRQQAMQRYPGALLTEESSAEAAGRRGTMLNLLWKPAEGAERSVLVAIIPSAAGILEFSAVAERSKSSEVQSSLMGLLQRLQSSEHGPLRMETFRQPEYN